MKRRLRLFFLGTFLISALILGGGTTKGLWTVSLLEVLALPLILMRAEHLRNSQQQMVLAFTGLVAAVFLVQLLPISLPNGRPDLTDSAATILTQDAWRTLDSALFWSAGMIIFFFVRSQGADLQNRLLAFIIVGVLANAGFGLIQFASTGGIQMSPLPFELGAGFFANSNHFSTLLFASIPLLVYQCAVLSRLIWAFVGVIAIVLIEFAAGSVAGIVLSLACSFVALVLVTDITRQLRFGMIAVSLAILALLVANWGRIEADGITGGVPRLVMLETTMKGIVQYLPFGSGFGTFPLVYPQFEAVGEIGRAYVNHAHNDYLELVLEGGLPALAFLVFYLVALLWRLHRVWASPLHRAMFCGIIFILLHSTVDYPLRTFAIMCVFACFNGIIFSPPSTYARQSR